MFIQTTAERADFAFLIAIEADPERAADSANVKPWMRPEILDQADASQMLAHVTADLDSVLGKIGKCHLVSCGVLLDQCQVLRPQLPVFTALSELLGDNVSAGITPGQTALGATDGSLPVDTLRPDPNIPPTVLLLLPILASGPRQLIHELAEEMEHRFLAEGQISAHTASWLEAAFGIAIKHGRFMTLTDLNAMFRMQLEHFGFLPLWQLVDAAVLGTDEFMSLTTSKGTGLIWKDGIVTVTFQPFNHWSTAGSGRDVETHRLGEEYAQWSRELRQYTSTLAAHQIPIRFELPEGCKGSVSDHFLCEETALPTGAESLAAVTEHAWPDLGIVAVTAETPGALKHFYPLTPEGLNDIHEIVQDQELSGEGMSFPGRIAYQDSNRQLRPGKFEA
ncbi:MAG TPA: hypothetical protein VJ984_14105 [Xanthomonadales bacterium]|nr:hypothetical protein [Xanthomonadales bacterium]